MKKAKVILAMLAAIFVLGACGSKKEAATEKEEKKDIKIACNQVSENSLKAAKESMEAEGLHRNLLSFRIILRLYKLFRMAM